MAQSACLTILGSELLVLLHFPGVLLPLRLQLCNAAAQSRQLRWGVASLEGGGGDQSALSVNFPQGMDKVSFMLLSDNTAVFA